MSHEATWMKMMKRVDVRRSVVVLEFSLLHLGLNKGAERIVDRHPCTNDTKHEFT